MPFNEFRTLKRKAPEGEGEERGTERGEEGRGERKSSYKEASQKLKSFIFLLALNFG